MTPAPRASSPRPQRRSVLGWAFSLAIVLALVIQGVLVTETVRARRDVERLFATGNRTHYHLNQVGLGVTRMRALALETLTERPTGFARERRDPASVRARIARLEGVLDASTPELDRLLGPAETARWRQLVPELRGLRSAIAAAFAAIASGRAEEAEDLLDSAAALSMSVQDQLASLAQINAARSELLRTAADERLAGVILLQRALALGLVLVLAAIGVATSRLLRAQRAQLDDYVRRLESANRDLDQFAGRVAHDLRNVLQPVGLASALLERSPSERVVARVAQDLGRTTQHASELIQALLAFARAGHSAPTDARAPVPAVVEEVCRLLHHDLARITCEVDVDEGEVACDRALLATAVLNVLGNATKHLDGLPAPRVRIEGRRRASCFELAISDNGPGFPPEALPYLFEPFFRAEGASGPGLGLGLATVKRVLEAYGGRVEASARPGGGAVFRLVLQLAAGPGLDGAEREPVSADRSPCVQAPVSS